jgi:hypothetical protein
MKCIIYSISKEEIPLLPKKYSYGKREKGRRVDKKLHENIVNIYYSIYRSKELRGLANNIIRIIASDCDFIYSRADLRKNNDPSLYIGRYCVSDKRNFIKSVPGFISLLLFCRY